MIVKSIEIENFGRHKHLTFNTDAPIVGIFGENGAGKSTLLDALEFAITGKLRDSQDSYVRNLDGSAIVNVEFQKDGRGFAIMRQCGKKAKRRLAINGEKEPLTAAKAVDEAMTKIFGSDKEAISNAVFINQGTLSNILFSGDADRRLLFIRLVNMAYCAQRAMVVDRKIKKLNIMAVDLTAAKDQAQAIREQAATNAATKKIAYDTATDPTEALHYCEEMLTNIAQVEVYRTGIEENTRTKAEAERDLAARLAAANMTTIDDLRAHVAQLTTKADTSKSQLSERETMALRISHYSGLVRDIAGIRQELERLDAEHATNNPDNLSLSQVSETLSITNVRVAAAKRRDHLQARRVELVAEFEKGRREMESAQMSLNVLDSNPQTSKAYLTHLKKLQGLNAATISAAERMLAARQEMLASGCIQPGQTSCGKCGLTIVDPNEVSPEAVALLAQQLVEMRTAAAATDTQAKEIAQAWEKVTASQAAIVYNQESRRARIREIDEELAIITETAPEQELRDELFRLQSLRQFLTAYPTRRKQVGDRMSDKTACKLQYVDVEKVLASGQRANYSNEEIAKLKQQTTDDSKNALEWAEYLRLTETFVQQITQLTEVIARSAESMYNLEMATNQLEPPKLVTEMKERDGNCNFAKFRTDLQMLQSERDSLRGAYEEALRAHTKAENDFKDLVARMKKDELRAKLVKDLEALKEMLSNDGLPMAVVRHHFEHLAALTQDYLTKLNANFQIQIDRGSEIGFTFTRLDEADGVELPMQKLSGGQRVKLCVAFLMACQQRLVKDVGLLVLDEPSVHVDAAGVESMIEMLQELGRALQNTEMQVWICDHHPAIERACGRVIKLEV
jgi:exonuclease SbcC